MRPQKRRVVIRDAANGIDEVRTQIVVGNAVIKERQDQPFNRRGARIRDIEKLIRLRYGGAIPEHDDPRNPYLYCMAHVVFCSFDKHEDQIGWFRDWTEKWAPWLQNKAAGYRNLVRNMRPQRIDMGDASAAKLLRLKLKEREAAGIATISPSDISQEEFKEYQRDRKKEMDRSGAQRRRRQAGSMTRAEYEAGSISAAKPWVKEGISRAKYYRILKKAKAQADGEIRAEDEVLRQVRRNIESIQ